MLHTDTVLNQIMNNNINEYQLYSNVHRLLGLFRLFGLLAIWTLIELLVPE